MSEFEEREKARDTIMAILMRKCGSIQNDEGTINQETATEFFDNLTITLSGMGLNPLTGDGYKGLEEYMEKDPNDINSVTTGSGIKASKVIANDTERWENAIKAPGRTANDVVPPPMTEIEANEMADRLNFNTARILGGKEAVLQSIITSFGKNATNAHTLQPNSNKIKELDDINLYELKEGIISSAERVSFNSARGGVIDLFKTTFNWEHPAATNVTALVTKAALLEPAGINVNKALIVLIIMSEWEKASKASGSWADDLKNGFRTVRSLYAVDHEHNDDSYKVVMEHLNKADKNRNLSDAPPPDNSAGEAHAVYDTYLQDLLQESESESELEEESDDESVAYSASSDSESSVDTKSARCAIKEKEKKKLAREAAAKKKKKEEEKAKKAKAKEAKEAKKDKKKKKKEKGVVNKDCKHCTTHRRFGSHPDVPEKKCRFNPKAKVWRPKWVCDLIEVKYIKRELFSEEDGGYPPLEDSDASSGSDSE